MDGAADTRSGTGSVTCARKNIAAGDGAPVIINEDSVKARGISTGAANAAAGLTGKVVVGGVRHDHFADAANADAMGDVATWPLPCTAHQARSSTMTLTISGVGAEGSFCIVAWSVVSISHEGGISVSGGREEDI
jgi:hypothetical protein